MMGECRSFVRWYHSGRWELMGCLYEEVGARDGRKLSICTEKTEQDIGDVGTENTRNRISCMKEAEQ